MIHTGPAIHPHRHDTLAELRACDEFEAAERARVTFELADMYGEDVAA